MSSLLNGQNDQPKTSKLEQYENGLTGAWKLTSYTVLDSDTPDANVLMRPLGDTPYGLIMFSPGYMSATLTFREEALSPLTTHEKWIFCSGEEVAKFARPFTHYAGPFVLTEGEGGGVVSQCDVVIALDPSWIGTSQFRRMNYEVRGDGRECLTLKPVQKLVMPDGESYYAMLKWEKLDAPQKQGPLMGKNRL